jgi:hypothetical protein
MLRYLALLILVIPAAPSPPPSKADCFPAEAGVNEFTTEWFCKQLAAADEGFLSRDPSYRFAYIPTFNATRVVVAFMDSGKPTVVGKVLSGQGGYDPGRVVHTTRRILTTDEWNLLEQRLENAGLWEPPDKDDRGLDGAEWVLEGRRQGHYRLHDVWSPTDSTSPQYRKVCIYMLELAGIRPVPKDLY